MNEGIVQEWFKISKVEAFESEKQLQIPSCWNYIKEDGEYKYLKYEGAMWFFKTFNADFMQDGLEHYVRFNAANYLTQVWLNETCLGSHEGGFLPFKFKISKLLTVGKNFLAVRVENMRKKDRIPCEGFDWFNYGGIYRDVFIDSVNEKRFKVIHVKTLEILRNRALIELNFELTSPFHYSWEIYLQEKVISQGNIDADAFSSRFIVPISSPRPWSVEEPVLYDLKVKNHATKEMSKVKFGIRKIEIVKGRIYINKKLMLLRGVSLHEELIPYGRAIPFEERKNDLLLMKELGFNALRTAHYSHDESLMTLADELGMFILEEIPIYWMIDFASPKILKLGAQMVKTLILRDYNHPSVIMWSLGNEIPVENKHCQQVIKSLYLLARSLDDSRLITHVSNKAWWDPLRKHADVVCLNMYFGWYYGSEQNLNFLLETLRPTARNKPFFITEFGGGAKVEFRSSQLEKFSEDKQASIIRNSIETFNSKDFVQGHFIWIFRDFKSAMRTNPYQQGFNRKGIVSEKNGLKLIARIYNKIKNIRTNKRSYRLLPILSKFSVAPLEGWLNDLIIGRIMKRVTRAQLDKYYKKGNE